MLGLETAALSIGEAGSRQLEGGKVEERLPHAVEPLLEASRERPDGRGSLGLGPHGREGVAQEGQALALGVRRPIGGDEDQGLAVLEGVAEHGAEERLLVFGGQSADRVGERGADASLVEALLDRRDETGGEGVAAGDPGLATPEEPCDRGEGEPVLADERVDDPRLVHRGEGARRGVRAQHEGLARGRPPCALEDDGDLGRARPEPAGEALEAVDDLEGAVVLGDGPQRQLRQRLRGLRPDRARAQRGEARAEAADGKVDDGRGVGGQRLHGHSGR